MLEAIRKSSSIESPIEKFIVFTIADYLLALPIQAVLRVVNCPPKLNDKLEKIKVAQVGRHMVRVLDFHQQFTPDASSYSSERRSFLVIIHGLPGELWGILVYQPPDVVELPIELMRSLPTSEDPSSLLRMVSHAAVIAEKEVTKTIFLMDPKRIVSQQ